MNKKIIWITGASSGIGKALAVKFAENGWKVAASARRENLLNELRNINQNIYPYPLDVTKIEKCISTAKSIIQEQGGIDICVFGTGMHDPKSEKRFNLDKIREIMEINYFGTINSINSVYDYFSEKKNGQLSIISSVAGYRGLPAAGAYCASKSALISYTESLYFDLKRKNVKVSIICPGFIKTPMTDQNDFPMPMLKSPEFAANKIYAGLIHKNNFEIHFPKSFTFLMKIIQILPNWLYFGAINLGNKYMKRD
jgi:short-subunit dehydrogenase|tara:strand:+ start:456 stop:1217 length:762 start_codon:yes stop_codon:yes gene_type:complete